MAEPSETPLPSANVDPLVWRLKNEIDTASQGGALYIGGGAAICFVSAIVFSIIIVALTNLWFGSSGIGFTGWLIVGLLICAGIIAWSIKKPPVIEPGAMNYIYGVPAEGVVGENWHEYPLIGPRMLVAGVKLANKAPKPAEDYFYDRCALFLRQLAKRGEAMPSNQLLIGEDETPLMLAKVIKYLDKRGWIGASSDQQRVWLSTRAKTELLRLGILKTP